MNDYYNYVNKANLSISKGENGMASLYFDSAFSNNEYPFLIDLNNAIYCQIFSGVEPNEYAIYKYLQKIEQKNVNLKQYYKDNPAFLFYVDKITSSKNRISIDDKLVGIVDKAIKTDQVLRTFSINELGNYYHEDVLMAINLLDSVNYLNIIPVLHKSLEKRIPLENLIGWDKTEDVEIILLHNVPWNRYNKELMDSMVQSGLLDARITSYYYDYYCTVLYPNVVNNWENENHCDGLIQRFGTSLMQTFDNGVVLIPILDSIATKLIDERRSAFYLMSLTNDSKVRAFYFFNKEKGFKYYLLSIHSGREEWIREMEGIFNRNYDGYIKYDINTRFRFDLPSQKN